MPNSPIVPPQASNFAGEYDALFFVLTALTVFFSALVIFSAIILAIRYRRGNKVDRSRPVDHNPRLEIGWMMVLLFLALGVFAWGAKLYAEMYTPLNRADALEVFVIGKQWMWQAQHTNGVRENNELHVPVGRPVKLTMISQDVIHSFFVPAFRIKRDVIPGAYTTVWFTPTKPGKYHLFCAEYCGTQHSEMGGYVYAMEPTAFQEWLATGGDKLTQQAAKSLTMADAGAAIYEQKACGNCHAGNAVPERGPSLVGIYNKVVKLANGQTARADDAYLREAILNPYQRLTAGYGPTMPVYKGTLTEEQVLQLIAYMKSLNSPGNNDPTNAPTSPSGGAVTAPTGAVMAPAPTGRNERQ